MTKFFIESSNFVQITIYHYHLTYSDEHKDSQKVKKENNHSPRAIKAQKDLHYKTLTNIFSLLFRNSMVKLFSMVCHLSLHITQLVLKL